MPGFNFTDEDIKIAKTFFDAADKVFEDALSQREKLRNKIDTETGEINIDHISDATIIEETVDKDGQIIEKQRPVIDLVQQGGGMWGIALLGYCYIMEKVGVRFYSHGGTSAGAINALFLSSISSDIYKNPPIIKTNANRGALKSEILTLIVSNMDFSEFMNRGGIAGKLQEMFFKNIQSIKLKIILAFSSLSIIILLYFLSITLLNYFANGLTIGENIYFSFIIGTLNIIAFILLVYIMLAKILGENFGLNTGNPFLTWVKDNLEKLKINSTNDLYDSLSKTQLVRSVRTKDLNENVKSLIETNRFKTKSLKKEDDHIIISNEISSQMASVTSKIYKVENPKIILIASNLTHNRIVRFPEDAIDYWKNFLNVHPAAYVRASMSLPFIFKTFIPNTSSHYKDENNVDNAIKLRARMVDGGMLSNFPIREFHRKSKKTPSFPTFGVLLSKRTKTNSKAIFSGQKNTLINYISSYISTFKNFYDNDFMNDNDEIKNRVVAVETRRNPDKSEEEINWLDFWMSTDDKCLLFKRGAEAAINQLEKFEWEDYKALRIKLAKDEPG